MNFQIDCFCEYQLMIQMWLEICSVLWYAFDFTGFAGRNKYGKKEELLARALELVKIRSSPLQAKIRELYKASQASQEVADMMGPNGQPINPYAGMAYANNLTQLMGLGGAYSNIQQQSLQGRNPYNSGYPPNSAQAMGGHPGHPGMFNSGYQQVN